MTTATARTPQPRTLQLFWIRQLRSWSPRRWAVALVIAGIVAVVTGVPTDVVPTSLYRRMTPVVWWNYPIWALSAVLTGLVVATYVRIGERRATVRQGGGGVAGGLLSFFAVGCPICNKLVVAMLGVGGAVTYFAPIQPLLGVAGLALLAATFAVRLSQLAACAAEIRSPAPAIPRSRK